MTKTVRIKRSQLSNTRRVSLFASCTNTLLGVWRRAYARQQQIDLQASKLLKAEQDRRIGEMVLAAKSNAVLLQDIKIEKEKLELLALKKKLGITDNEFAPEMTQR